MFNEMFILIRGEFQFVSHIIISLQIGKNLFLKVKEISIQ